MLVSGVQQSDSLIIHIHVSVLFQILLLIRVLQHIEQRSLCYAVGPCWLSILSVKVKLLSHVQFFATPWTVAHQAPPSMGFSEQEYWSGLPFSIVVCKCNKEEKIYLQYCNFTASVYKINHLSVPTSIYLVGYKILCILHILLRLDIKKEKIK